MKHFGKWYEIEYVVKQNEVKERMPDFSECSCTGEIYLTIKMNWSCRTGLVIIWMAWGHDKRYYAINFKYSKH